MPIDDGGIVCQQSLDTIALALREVVERLGPVDVLVNNAGVRQPIPFGADEYFRSWDATIAVNLEAPVRMARACLTHLARDGAGRIINIASTEGLGATPYLSPYSTSKHGLVGVTRSLAVELGRTGVTVNCVCPGPIHTAMTAHFSDKDKQTYSLTNTQEQTLKPGQRVELVGKKTKDDSGEPTFEVHKMSKDLGMCTPTTAENR